jgi:metal-responsive CopG/Arc/MetJ family transcriptional regulator
MTLPPDLIEAVDGIAAEQERSRAKMVEMALRQFVQSYRSNQEAA